MDKVLTDDGFFGVSEDSLERTFRSLLEGSLHFVGRGGLFEADRQVNQGNVRSRNTDGHTRQLSIQGRDDLADGLGGTRRGGDQVVKGRTSSAPVLTTFAGAVHDELRGGTGVDGRHEAFNDTEFFVNDLGERSQAVGSARGVGKDGFSSILVVVDTHNEHRGIRRRSRDDDTLGTTLQVKRGLFNGGEDTGGFADSVSAGFSPRNVLRIAFGEELDLQFTNDEASVFSLDGLVEGSVDRIVLKLVDSILERQEGIVDGNDGGVRVVQSGTEDETTDTAKSIDSKSDGHGVEFLVGKLGVRA
mmetsp:Transcript_14277/g.28798  ORF Transcript_14277/g.28798 Transcript_14277/m.28798 type:complete len:302 (-) Transcript_14277:145-1050(-)